MLEPKTLQIDIPRGDSLLDNIQMILDNLLDSLLGSLLDILLDDLLDSLLDSRTCLACEEKFRRYLVPGVRTNAARHLL